MAEHPIIPFLVSVLAAFGAAILAAQWLMNSLHATHAAGLARLANAERTSTFVLGSTALPTLVERGVTTLLPLVEGWREKDQFGSRAYLYTVDRRLIRGGLRTGIGPEQFAAVSILAAILSVLILVPVWTLTFGLSFLMLPLVAAASLAVGYGVPTFILREHNLNRVSLIDKRLPFAIEFILLAMEAQAAFPTALRVYCDQAMDDPLADELRLTLGDMELGGTPKEAMNAFADRLESDAVTAFVLALNSGLDQGQPLKDILEVQSDATRLRRYQSAEQIAKTASTRAIFPLFLVAFAVMILLVGPLLIKVTQSSFF